MKLKVATISFPWESQGPYKFLSNLLDIIDPMSDKITLIGGNTNRIHIRSKKVVTRDINVGMHYLSEIKPTFYSVILWFTKCILAQIKTVIELIKARKDIDIVIFYMAYPYYIFTLIIAKILRKKTIEVVTRSNKKNGPARILSLQDPILFRLLDGISPESPALIKELNLEKFLNKISPNGSRFIDTSMYKTKKKFNDRRNIVGYIGRITEEKGVKNFIKSISIIKKDRKDIEFLIVGSGELLDWVKSQKEKIENEHNLNVIGFVTEEKLPDYYNELRLFVLPTTHAEGLPTTILEAMACGTPVLTTSIGAIPDIIKDGQTGHIMENNSPECIAKNVMMALEHPDTDKIIENSIRLIENDYTYEKAVERYRKILLQLTPKGDTTCINFG